MGPFQAAAIGIFAVFMGVMVVVTFVAYSRPSGRSTVNMARIQQMRYESTNKSAAKEGQLADR